jgi:carboxypeptidase D
VPQVAHDMILRFMGVDFSRLHEGTAGKIESSINGTEKQSISPGNSALSDIEQKAKWEGRRSSTSAAVILFIH